MIRRLFAFVVLLALVAAGLYVWKLRPGGFGVTSLRDVKQGLEDAKTTASVKAALGLNRRLKPLAIDVSSERGVVTLRGEVPEDGLREAAEQVAGAVPGVGQVVNHVKVVAGSGPFPDGGRDRTLGESFDDEALAVQVKLALSLRKDLAGTSVEVEAYRRQVTLSGRVDRPEQRAQAVATARETGGVEGVTDRIEVEVARVEPSGAKAAAEAALRGNPNLARYDLEVGEDKGRLVLRGRVRTGAEKELAGLLAEQAAKAPVQNGLQVLP